MFNTIRKLFTGELALAGFSFGALLTKEDLDQIARGNSIPRDGLVFPGYVLFGLRDDRGFNPRVMWLLQQFGQRDPHLLPNGFRTFIGGFSLRRAVY